MNLPTDLAPTPDVAPSPAGHAARQTVILPRAAAGARGTWRRRAITIVGPAVVLAGIIGAWFLISYKALDPARRFLMPPPQEVISDGLLGPNINEMLQGLVQTALVAGLGLTLAFVVGLTWAVAMHQARWIEASLVPYAVVLQCVPILALVPLFGFWFGFGLQSRVLVCAIIALFPIVSNTLFGLKSVDRGYLDLFALRGASRWSRLRKLELPAATPAIFAGLRISAGLAVVGAIVSDFFFKQGEAGIGVLIDNYRARLQSPQLFAAVLLASAFGVLVYAFFGWLTNRVVGAWHNPHR